MKKTALFFASILMLMLPWISACDDNDDDSGSSSSGTSLTGWYARSSDLNGYSAKSSDFREIEQAIQEKRLLGSQYVDRLHTLYYYASRDMFVYGDGSFGCTGNKNHYGNLFGIITSSLYAIHIVDSKTLVSCTFNLFVDEDMTSSRDLEKIATIYRGSVFKSVSVYCSTVYYSYAKVDNKLICDDGHIYTVMTDGSIVEDGTSSFMKKFDPKSFFISK